MKGFAKFLLVGISSGLLAFGSVASGQTIINNGGSGSGFANPTSPPVAAFVVGCDANASDSNAGTVAAPLATFTQAHTLMAASTNVKTTYVRGLSNTGAACTYTISSATNTIGSNSNERWVLYPGDPQPNPQACVQGSGLITVTTTNLGDFTGTNILIKNLSFTSTQTANPLFQFNLASNIYLLGNFIQDTGNIAFVSFTSPGVYLQGNCWRGGTTSGLDNIELTYNTGALLQSYTNVFVTDNYFGTGSTIDCTRFCIEFQNQSTGNLQTTNIHVDRNNCAFCLSTTNANSQGFISAVFSGVVGDQNSDNTVYQNFASRGAGLTCSLGDGGLEIVGYGLDVENNNLVNFCYPIGIAGNAQTVFANNSFTIDLTATNHQGYSQDGLYKSDEWIGYNYYNNSGTVSYVAGCPGLVTPTWCGLGFNSYGERPNLSAAPSASYFASATPW